MYHISSEVGLSPLHTAQSSSELITGHVTCKARLGTTIEKKRNAWPKYGAMVQQKRE